MGPEVEDGGGEGYGGVLAVPLQLSEVLLGQVLYLVLREGAGGGVLVVKGLVEHSLHFDLRPAEHHADLGVLPVEVHEEVLTSAAVFFLFNEVMHLLIHT